MIGADVIDAELPLGQADAAFAQDGRLVEPQQRAALAELLSALSARAGAPQERAV
jgi:chromate reductase